ncbi:hypothetical protein HW555_004108 [Spodoptera exigua]|uniref:Uncharacterized protein n=1 Tax=Spodoptera exigua TaxID=7107 RepID=A0A835GKA4_SPOEX|nr:hypothetical protein HW555_004108 [Spodoptera exigua]
MFNSIVCYKALIVTVVLIYHLGVTVDSSRSSVPALTHPDKHNIHKAPLSPQEIDSMLLPYIVQPFKIFTWHAKNIKQVNALRYCAIGQITLSGMLSQNHFENTHNCSVVHLQPCRQKPGPYDIIGREGRVLAYAHVPSHSHFSAE